MILRKCYLIKETIMGGDAIYYLAALVSVCSVMMITYKPTSVLVTAASPNFILFFQNVFFYVISSQNCPTSKKSNLEIYCRNDIFLKVFFSFAFLRKFFVINKGKHLLRKKNKNET